MSIVDNLKQVQEHIASACAKVNRNVDDVTLVAVSKKKSVSDILEAIQAGQQHFGENRVEESTEKIPQINAQIATPVTWHMVGHIQSRKAKHIVTLFDMIQSLDSVKLAQKLSRLGVDHNQTIQVLLEVNVSGEEAKYGFNGYNWHQDKQTKDRLWQEFHDIIELPNINVCGLMTMAPFVDNMELIRPVFAELFALREELSNSFDTTLPELSMGMTNDYPIAIEEGATIIRVGRAIFGERQYKI
jgi:PLP dependent protein